MHVEEVKSGPEQEDILHILDLLICTCQYGVSDRSGLDHLYQKH